MDRQETDNLSLKNQERMKGDVGMAIISKLYCAPSTVVLLVRIRPHVVNGGGFVVTDCGQNNVVFRVEGCGTLGTPDNLILRDTNGNPLLLIRRKGGMVEALISTHRNWKGYSSVDYEGLQKLVFSLKEPKSGSCWVRSNNAIRISTEPRRSNNNGWDFEIKGSFPDRTTTIVDHLGDVVAQVGVKKEMELVMTSKDLYQVVVKPGVDQAFVFGIIAVLDNIHGESTTC